MIRVDSLFKRYPGAPEPTLRGLSFEVPEGTTVAILGRSGAGKSTLLRCLIGLEPFDRGVVGIGEVKVQGAEAAASRREHRAAVAGLRARLGLVFQSFELFPHLTVLQNCVLAPVRVRGESMVVATGRALELLGELGLADKAGAYPDLLSGGQRQRVAIVRALAMEPRALLYDEPTSALDPSLRHEVALTLQRIQRERGVTQVLVTHDVALARSTAQQVFILDRGEVVEQGPPEQVLSTPQHEATRRLLAAPP